VTVLGNFASAWRQVSPHVVKELIALQGGSANGPFVTAENIAKATRKVTETLGFKSPAARSRRRRRTGADRDRQAGGLRRCPRSSA
jgi:hypothetical protein